MRLDLDIIDRKILSFLQEDARITLTEMAKRLYISRNAVRYRIELMEKQGLIEGYTTVVNPLFSDNPTLAFILFDVKPNNVAKCIRILKRYDEVYEIFRLSSGTAIFIKAFFKNAHHKRSFILENIEGMPVENFTVHTVAQIGERKGIPVKYLE
ncbi:MAG: Lrp/AsnC family transcriptional regulator [Methanomassiliicoccales archaeon]|nr:MAG: Lrp/AsnC family transcriptional regulator [Methanomassiliicoccales archaeon]